MSKVLIKKFTAILLLGCLLSINFILAQTTKDLTPMPIASIGDWKLSANIQTFDPDNLFNYINGAADNYLSYKFKELNSFTYETTPDNYITVDVYNQEELKQAFGIYVSERPLNATLEDFGAQGYQGEGILNFFIDKYYVKISTHNREPETKNAMVTIAKDLSLKLSNNKSMPTALQLLPSQNKIPNSESFTNSNFLGYGFFQSAFIANYNKGSKIFKLFVMVYPTQEQALEALSKYTEITKANFNGTEGRYTINDPHNGEIKLEWKGCYIWGILNDQKVKIKEDYLQMIKSKL